MGEAISAADTPAAAGNITTESACRLGRHYKIRLLFHHFPLQYSRETIHRCRSAAESENFHPGRVGLRLVL